MELNEEQQKEHVESLEKLVQQVTHKDTEAIVAVVVSKTQGSRIIMGNFNMNNVINALDNLALIQQDLIASLKKGEPNVEESSEEDTQSQV